MRTLETSEKSLVEQVEFSIAHRQPLVIEGGGSKNFYGHQPSEDLPILSVAGHRGVIDYAPDELMIRVRAGTPLSEVNQLLKENSQFLAFEPPDFGRKTTIGGVVASGLSGPRRPYAGSVRDYVLGVTLITGSGNVLSFGGQVMKNVAGYDVSRLVTGAMGTLGVILDVSLKVLPAPEAESSVAKTLPAEEFPAFLRTLRKNIPLSAAAYQNGVARLRVSGSRVAVDAALLEFEAEKTVNEYWDRLNTLVDFGATKELWRISLVPASPLFLDEAAVIDWGGGVRWLVNPGDNPRKLLAGEDGHATLFKRSVSKGTKESVESAGDTTGSAVELFHPLGQPLLGIHQRLKNHFDPAAIFNPGRMYQGL